MTRDELHASMRRAAGWGALVGIVGSAGFTAWAVVTEGPEAGSLADFLALLLIATGGGAALFTMSFIRWSSNRELQAAVGWGRVAAYMAALFVGMVALMFVTNAVAMRW